MVGYILGFKHLLMLASHSRIRRDKDIKIPKFGWLIVGSGGLVLELAII